MATPPLAAAFVGAQPYARLGDPVLASLEPPNHPDPWMFRLPDRSFP
jgi:hypothetical protein